MANLSFYYGTMESGKTTKIIQDHYNYNKNGLRVLLIKPYVDTKGDNKIVTRKGDSIEVDLLLKPSDSLITEDLLDLINESKIILVDEAQFLSKEQIKELWFIAHFIGINVIAYGLKNNFKGELFEGSSALLALADQKTELTVTCRCGETAMFNARCINGVFTGDGPELVIDGENAEVEYIPLCGDCFLKEVESKRIDNYKRILKKTYEIDKK